MIQLSGSVILLSSNEVIHWEKRERKAKLMTAYVIEDKDTVKLHESLENCYLSSYSHWSEVHVNETLTCANKFVILMHDCALYLFNLTLILCYSLHKQGMWRPYLGPIAISIKYVLCSKKNLPTKQTKHAYIFLKSAIHQNKFTQLQSSCIAITTIHKNT